MRNDDFMNFLMGLVVGLVIQSMFKIIPDNLANENGNSDY